MTPSKESLQKRLADVAPRDRVLLEAVAACPEGGAPTELLIDLFAGLDDEGEGELDTETLVEALAGLAEGGLLQRPGDDLYAATPGLVEALDLEPELRTMLTLYHASTTEMLLREAQAEAEATGEVEAERALAPQVRHAVARLTREIGRVHGGDRQEAAALLLELARERDLDENDESNDENDARAAEAAARAVLKLDLRERTPELWADAQMTLGFALAALPSNGSNNDEASIAAFRAAASVSKGENRAYALSCVADALALRVDGDDVTNIREALKVYEEALAAISSRDQPEAYADIQANVGELRRQLYDLDEGEDPDPALLDASLAAFDAALVLQRGEELRLARAISLRGRGDTLRAMPAANEADRYAKLEQAIASYGEALELLEGVEAEVGDRLEGDDERAGYLLALGSALHELADEGERPELLVAASERYRAALALSSEDEPTPDRAMVLINLAGLLCDIHEDAPTAAHFEEASALCQEALRIVPVEVNAESWAAAQINLGGVHLKLRDGGEAALREAKRCYEAALEVLEEDAPSSEIALEDLAEIEEKLAAL